MPRPKSSSTEINKLKRALLRDGAATYPLAMQALAEFRLEVFSVCRRVAERRKKVICRLLGIPTATAQIEDEGEEVDASQDGTDTYLWVYLRRANLGSFYVGPSWEGAGSRPSAVRAAAYLTFDRKATFEKVKNALQERFGDKVTIDDEWWQCWRAISIRLSAGICKTPRFCWVFAIWEPMTGLCR